MKLSIHSGSSVLSRRAFTLIEIMVAIGIMVVLLSLALLAAPKAEKRLASQGADQLQTFLASARSRALRDGRPTGVRLLPNANGNGTFTSFQYIQQPDPFVPEDIVQPTAQNPFQGVVTLNVTNTPSLRATINMDLTGHVAQGDLLEIGQPGQEISVHRVNSVVGGINFSLVTLATTPDLSTITPPLQFNSIQVHPFKILPNPPPPLPMAVFVNPGYRFIRAPQPLIGEPLLQMPRYVRVEPDTSVGGLSLNLSSIVSQSGNFDIVFAPSGHVVASSVGRIVLWVDDDNGVSAPTLLTIYTRTGAIAAHVVAPGANPYAFTQDGNSSGQ